MANKIEELAESVGKSGVVYLLEKEAMSEAYRSILHAHLLTLGYMPSNYPMNLLDLTDLFSDRVFQDVYVYALHKLREAIVDLEQPNPVPEKLHAFFALNSDQWSYLDDMLQCGLNYLEERSDSTEMQSYEHTLSLLKRQYPELVRQAISNE